MGNVVAVFVGLPGTGKSTMAELTAHTLGAPAFAGDWLLGALKPAAEALAQLDRVTYLALYRSLLTSLITRQLILGQSAVLDCLAPDDVLEQWQVLAEDHGADFRVIECVCSDAALHRSRVEGRVRNIPGWHEIGWDHVLRMRDELPPITAQHLTLDAVHPVDVNRRAVADYLQTSPG